MIEVNGLRYSYPSQKEEVIKGISFSISSGQIFGFLGPSGAGKSTTQKILTGLLRNYSGELIVAGKKPGDWGYGYYQLIGVGFELPNHYLKLTARENLQFFATFYKKIKNTPEELLNLVNLQDDADKKVAEFSKGMKMRLNFVRALMHDPEIIFLDEPTSGLDPANARKIKDIILKLKAAGKTIFITTHNMHDAEELCDQVAFINKGEIALVDSPHALKLQYGNRSLKVHYVKETTQEAIFSLDQLKYNEKFWQLINQYKINSMHSAEASLEEIFIKVTGSRLT